MPSRAGQANEAGSVYRRGVAVYLAAYGLAGRPVVTAEPGPGQPVPVALAFETRHATDDLLCTLSDGARLFISAKRTCGDDAQLADTLAQWVAQAESLSPYDRLVLATAEPTGIVRHLGDALRRRRQAPNTVFPVKEHRALEALQRRLADLAPDRQERVLDAAVVLINDADQPGRLHHEVATGLLEGTVVPAGQGVTALSHLSDLMHVQAGAAYEGDVDSWVRYLVELDIDVYADRGGVAGAVIRARQLAVEHYCESLQATQGQVDLSLLAEDLQPLVVEDLVDHLRVTVDGADRQRPVSLLTVARRRSRLLVEGLPGAGKSAALTELAARWAADDDAPVPVLVRLHDLGRTCRSHTDVTLTRLCEEGAARAPIDQKPELVEALVLAVAQGDAVLLLDGLDECLDRRAIVAEGLRHVLSGLPSDTGVVLTTRHSGVAAARRLGLDTVRLTTPDNLDDVLDRLLRHVAVARVRKEHQEAWVADRSRRVRAVRASHRDVGSVPLLSVLITLVLADSDDATTSDSAAHVLYEAVMRTVKRWERRRLSHPGAAPPIPSDGQLLLGFQTIGHLLSVRADSSVADVEAAVSQAMTLSWGMASGPAAEMADAIRRFWDDHVGVFVADASAHVVPRSRVFAEIGAAMHGASMSDTELRGWLSTALTDPERQDVLRLAVQLDHRVIDHLLLHDDADHNGALLVFDALIRGASLAAEQLSRLLDLLASAAAQASTANPLPPSTAAAARPAEAPEAVKRLREHRDERHLRDHGPLWPWARKIAQLPLPPSLEGRRVRLLERLPLTVDQHDVAWGIAGLAAADAVHRPLTPAEQERVLAMLAVPLPPRPPVEHPARNMLVIPDSVGPLPGLGEAAARAAARLSELGPRAAELLSELAGSVGYRHTENIVGSLQAHGHTVDLLRPLAETLVFFAQLGDDYRQGTRALLSSVAGLATEDVPLTRVQRWRLPELCDFLDVLEDDEVGVRDFTQAVEADSPETRGSWLRYMALAAGLDLQLLAAQARAALEDDDGEGFPAPFELTSAWPSMNPLELQLDRIPSDDRSGVVDLLTARSDWIADSADRLLRGSGEPGLDDRVAALFSAVGPQRRFSLALLCPVLSAQPAVRLESLLENGDSSLRRAAAWLLRHRATGPAATQLRERALHDQDATVRLAAGARSLAEPGILPPAYWSCSCCLHRNELDQADCEGCESGSRPQADKDQTA